MPLNIIAFLVGVFCGMLIELIFCIFIVGTGEEQNDR